MKKIVFVGGHHTSALAVISELETSFKEQYSYFWIGHKYSIWGDANVSAEYKEVTSLNIPFFDLQAGKFYRTYNPLKLLRLPWGFVQAFFFLLKIRPDLVMSFGGYLAVPVCFWAWVFGIKILAHEQTVVAGLANKVTAGFANKILLAWPQSASEFPKNKVAVVGLPLRHELLEIINQPLEVTNQLPLIYITGGKQGSHLINEALYKILPDLLNDFRVIHQCGGNSIYNDLERFKGLSKTLPEGLSKNYIVADFFEGAALSKIYQEATIVVGRSGAHTVYELLAIGKPAILIPLPWVSHNEQVMNAQVLVAAGLGEVLPESELSAKALKSKIYEMLKNIDTYLGNVAKARALVTYDAAAKITAEIDNTLREV